MGYRIIDESVWQAAQKMGSVKGNRLLATFVEEVRKIRAGTLHSFENALTKSPDLTLAGLAYINRPICVSDGKLNVFIIKENIIGDYLPDTYGLQGCNGSSSPDTDPDDEPDDDPDNTPPSPKKQKLSRGEFEADLARALASDEDPLDQGDLTRNYRASHKRLHIAEQNIPIHAFLWGLHQLWLIKLIRLFPIFIDSRCGAGSSSVVELLSAQAIRSMRASMLSWRMETSSIAIAAAIKLVGYNPAYPLPGEAQGSIGIDMLMASICADPAMAEDWLAVADVHLVRTFSLAAPWWDGLRPDRASGHHARLVARVQCGRRIDTSEFTSNSLAPVGPIGDDLVGWKKVVIKQSAIWHDDDVTDIIGLSTAGFWSEPAARDRDRLTVHAQSGCRINGSEFTTNAPEVGTVLLGEDDKLAVRKKGWAKQRAMRHGFGGSFDPCSSIIISRQAPLDQADDIFYLASRSLGIDMTHGMDAASAQRH